MVTNCTEQCIIRRNYNLEKDIYNLLVYRRGNNLVRFSDGKTSVDNARHPGLKPNVASPYFELPYRKF